ncbi:MAG: AAA family ATPase [Magnetococcales bacterium]|nr:AAA family ATPase [Magnetococcales bacterium]
MPDVFFPGPLLEIAGMNGNVVWMDFNTAAPQENTGLLEPMVPDPGAISSYMDLVFGYCEGWIPFRAFADIGQGLDAKPHTIWVESDEMTDLASAKEKAITFARWAARDGMAFYVIPGTVAEQGQAKAVDITQTQVILVDLDSGNIEAKLEYLSNHLGEPTAVIESGGVTQEGMAKLHAYWRLSEPAEGEDIAQACRVRHQIAIKVGGDIHFQSAHQPIRVAGSVYHKHGRTRLVSFRSLNTRKYHLPFIAVAANDMPTMEGIDTSGLDFNDAGPNKPTVTEVLTTPIRDGAQDAWTRFAGASAAIGHFIRMAHSGQMGRDEAWEAISQYNAAILRPPWPQDRLAAEAQRLWEKHCEKHGEPAITQSNDDPLPTFRLEELLADDSPMPLDIITPRLLTPGGIMVIGGAPKVGKSDFLIHLLARMAAGMEFLGFAPPRPFGVFYLQTEIQYHYLRERMKRMEFPASLITTAGRNLVLTPKVKMLLNIDGAKRTIAAIQRNFPDSPPDIICIDPLRNVFDGGPDGSGENDNNAMLFFLQERIERIRDAVNPEAGIILSHHTKKLSKKQLMEDPFQALSGAGSLRSFYTSGVIMYRTDEEKPERMLQFELRNGPAIAPMMVDKIDRKWMKIDRRVERLVRQEVGEKFDAERRRKHDVILQLIFDAAARGQAFTSNQFVEQFENLAGLGGKDTIRARIGVLATKGYIKFFKNHEAYGLLPANRSKFGYLCVEGMSLRLTDGEAMFVTPTHFKCPQSGAVLPVENPQVWVYSDNEVGLS